MRSDIGRRASPRVLKVTFNSAKNCFVSVSEIVYHAMRFEQVIPVIQLLDLDDKFIGYFSCQPLSSLAPDELAISFAFAKKLDIAEDTLVLAETRESTVAASQIYVTAEKSSDWDVIELNGEAIQSSLLNHVRIVWAGAIIPVWVSKSLSVYVRIVSSQPAAGVVRLEQFTEVVIGPPEDEVESVLCRNMGKALPARNEACSTCTSLAHLDMTDHLSCQLRVYPVTVDPAILKTKADRLLSHPYNVFVSEQSLPVISSSNLLPTFVARIGEIGVGVVVIEKIKLTLSADVQSWIDSNFLIVVPGGLFVTDTLRRVLSLKVADHVTLENVTSATNMATDIELMTVSTDVSSATHTDALMSSIGLHHPMLVNTEKLIPLNVNGKLQDYVIKLKTNDISWAWLCPKLLRTCNVTNCEIPINDLPDESVSSIVRVIGCQETLGTCSRFVQSLLCVKWPFSGIAGGGLLITGSSGSGKTTIAQFLAQKFAQAPYYVWFTQVDCKCLRGKKPENIQKTLETAFMDAYSHQPSIILIEDLESLMASAESPEQESGSQSRYFQRNSEVLLTVTKKLPAPNHVAIIATCKSKNSVQTSLVAPKGAALFQLIVEIPPISAEECLDYLKLLMSERFPNESPEALDLKLQPCVNHLDGFVAHDLEMILHRAVMFSESHKNGLKLETDDFTQALTGYTPVNMRGIKLHKPDGQKKWDDVGGLRDIKKILENMLLFPSKYPKLFASSPIRFQSGILLFGAPGTGKTLLASVVANECGLNFISIKGPELLSKYIGASEQAVVDLFQRAQSAKPCLLFFDEFDSLAPRRGRDRTGVTDRVVNQLLTQLDGVEGLSSGVYILAATSRPDLIDPALLRPGRIDKVLYCPLPDETDRIAITKAQSRNMKIAAEVDFAHLASKTLHFTGADIHAMLYNAQLLAVNEVLETNTAADENQFQVSSEKIRWEVTQEHLTKALANLRPSLPDDERKRYEIIYQQFLTSRGSFVLPEDIKNQRATLA